MPSAERQQAWLEARPVTLEENGKIACAQCWIFQTWAYLQRAGFSTKLVHALPDEGIVLTISGCLPTGFVAPPKLFVADIVADGCPHPGAHFHIVQNAAHSRRLVNSAFMPLWPQPHIIPRDESRGRAFETIAFFGDVKNLAAELRDSAWQDNLLQKSGAKLEIRGSDRWHDYHDVDAVIAIRDFSRRKQLHKPATKLYNAWLAGVPFVGGMDSAYAADGNPGADYLIARSPQEALDVLVALSQDFSRRQHLVEQGRQTVQDFTPESITQRWQNLLSRDMPQRAEKYFSRPMWRRQVGNLSQRMFCFVDRLFTS